MDPVVTGYEESTSLRLRPPPGGSKDGHAKGGRGSSGLGRYPRLAIAPRVNQTHAWDDLQRKVNRRFSQYLLDFLIDSSRILARVGGLDSDEYPGLPN